LHPFDLLQETTATPAQQNDLATDLGALLQRLDISMLSFPIFVAISMLFSCARLYYFRFGQRVVKMIVRAIVR
jgi:hypothetical protein